MQKWEYKKISRQLNLATTEPLKPRPASGPIYIWVDIVDEEDTSRYTDEMGRLKQLGIEGWELVAVQREHTARKFVYDYYLKRPIE
jgi:hypothetical protein